MMNFLLIFQRFNLLNKPKRSCFGPVKDYQTIQDLAFIDNIDIGYVVYKQFPGIKLLRVIDDYVQSNIFGVKYFDFAVVPQKGLAYIKSLDSVIFLLILLVIKIPLN
jgi:hypothetical protein